MKRCPQCKRDYRDETLLYCLDDGTRLLDGSAAGESVTQLFHQAPRLIDRAGGDLPAERTRFIGRKSELSDCVELLRITRLLTITGFGGCGKTRLAIKSAEAAADSFTDGTWFVDLEPVADQNMVVSAIGRAFQLREAGANVADTLVRQIGQSRLLIILDNCEHILSGVVAIVDELLTRCPGVRIIATSREPLNVQGEKVFSLQPLAVPNISGSRNDYAVNSDAVDLFVDRAAIAQTGFALSDRNLPTVVDIVTKLEGIPLAIELAAARLRILSIDQINEKLDQRFRLLAGASTSRVSRHQTLHAAIQWSYDPLSDDEKGLLRTLSVFSGSCDLDEITAVHGRFDEFTTLDALARLVDKSLVIVESERGSQKRYRLLETVREFAVAILSQNGEEAEVRRAHLKTMLGLAESAYQGRISNEDEWADVLELETSNMQQALEFARVNDSDAYLKLAGALGWYWTARSHISEGREHLSAALKSTSRDPARVDRARALWAAAHIEAWRGNLDAANLWMEEALECCGNLGDTSEVAIVLEGIGWSQFSSGKDEEACASFEECLRIQRAGGDPFLINRANVGLAQTLVALGRIDEARPMAREIIEFSTAHADKRNEHFGWHYLADCALIEGDYKGSLELYKKSLALAAETGDKIETAFEIQGVAMSLAGLGRSREAELLEAAVGAEMNRIGADIHVRFWDALLEKHLGEARGELGTEAAREARSEGASIGFIDAVAVALRVGEQSGDRAVSGQES